MEPAGDSDHGGVIGCELELRKESGPSSLAALFLDTGTQAAVCRNASSDSYLPDACMLCSLNELVHQDIDESLLETCAYIGLVLLHELRIDGHLVTHEIQQRGLDSAEAVVETRNMRFREFIFQRISFLGKTVYNRSARISEPHHLRTFVKRLTHSVIDGLTENLIFKRAVHTYNLRVTSRNQQTEIRELRLTVFPVILLDEVRQNMSLEMVHLDQRLVQGHCKALGE